MSSSMRNSFRLANRSRLWVAAANFSTNPGFRFPRFILLSSWLYRARRCCIGMSPWLSPLIFAFIGSVIFSALAMMILAGLQSKVNWIQSWLKINLLESDPSCRGRHTQDPSALANADNWICLHCCGKLIRPGILQVEYSMQWNHTMSSLSASTGEPSPASIPMDNPLL